MSKRYRKKPVEIDAIRFTEENRMDCITFCDPRRAIWPQVRTEDGQAKIRIVTLEGDMMAGLVDWIIKGIAGEFYPCKHEIFIRTYDGPIEVSDE